MCSTWSPSGAWWAEPPQPAARFRATARSALPRERRQAPRLTKRERAAYRRDSPSPPQLGLLHAPGRHLTEEQLVLVAAVDRIDDAELLRHASGRTELAEDLAVETHLVDRRVVHAVDDIADVRDVDV